MIIFPLLLASCATFGPYPKAPVTNHTDTHHNIVVKDPYRYMENPDDSRRVEWLRKEATYSADYFTQIKDRLEIKHELRDLLDFPRYSSLMRLGRRYIFFENTGLQNQSVLYIQNGLKNAPRILLDPNSLSTDGTVALRQVAPSWNNRKLAYALSRKGTDSQEIHVLELTTNGKKLKDVVKEVKFSNIAWHREGYFYSKFDKTGKHGIYYHKIGQKQRKDTLIYSGATSKQSILYAYTTEEQRYLIICEEERGSTGNSLHYLDLKTHEQGVQTLVSDYQKTRHPIDVDGDLLYVIQEGSVYTYNLKTKTRSLIIPSNERLVEDAVIANKSLVINTIENAANALYVYSLKGEQIAEIKLPGQGSVSQLYSKQGYSQIYFSYSSFTTAPTLYRYDLKRNKLNVFKRSKPQLDLTQYTSELHMVPSKDGTRIPMHIVRHKNVKQTGKNPTILYGYGGFNVPLLPRYIAGMYYLLERDGIFAQASIRGGGEYGEKWHQGGMKLNKQNSFDDFTACANYLIKNKYTSSEKLGLQGGSNGGLLVGGMTVQHPDLFQVGLIQVGVLDMLRFHAHTIGWAWEGDYGSVHNVKEFENLKKLSPYHNIEEGVDYPATLLLTADHDDRVVPFHSFKFLAELQAKGGRKNPYLLRLETNAGHGAGTPLSKRIDEYTDLFAFFLCNTKEFKPAPHKK
ncbi:MAG: Prolyl endopeptidase [Chlamydiia bacterium]|nr:Prolyl endopeptidase [Chlamydiia bacterium]MCH9615605.1 Prolyl endopeptidase [Chlamydiia bacterium]MCH9628992.1 Prolyl endopeptidase [Chlamydiia bacterium]